MTRSLQYDWILSLDGVGRQYARMPGLGFISERVVWIAQAAGLEYHRYELGVGARFAAPSCPFCCSRRSGTPWSSGSGDAEVAGDGGPGALTHGSSDGYREFRPRLVPVAARVREEVVQLMSQLPVLPGARLVTKIKTPAFSRRRHIDLQRVTSCLCHS